MELLSTASVASSQIVRFTAVLRHAHDISSAHSKKLSRISQLKLSIKSMRDTVEFHKAHEEGLNVVLAKGTAECTRLGELFDSTGAQLVVLREKLAAKDAVVKSIVENICTMLGPSLRNVVEGFRGCVIRR